MQEARKGYAMDFSGYSMEQDLQKAIRRYDNEIAATDSKRIAYRSMLSNRKMELENRLFRLVQKRVEEGLDIGTE